MPSAFLTAIAAAQLAAFQQYGLVPVGDVAGEPISLLEARAQCRVDLWGSPPESADDYWLTNIGIPGARGYCEQYKGIAYAPRTLELSTNAFPAGAITLPLGPAQSITSVKYLDTDGAEQTMPSGDYALDVYVDPAVLRLAYGATWPVARDTTNSVKVRYVAGYSLPTDSPIAYVLPPMVKMGMLLMLGHLFANREAVNIGNITTEVPLGVQALLNLAPGVGRLGMA